ncbi:MAG: hypothetical protein ACOX0A_01965 [Thermoguttaceae bacterium]|jgi:hypothetical protein
MSNWTKVIILLVIISLGIGFGGYLLYKKNYAAPRAEISQKREQLTTFIENGKQTTNNVVERTTQLESLYTRSFPTSRPDAALQYELWLSQMLDFCNMSDAQISRLAYQTPRNSGMAIQNFRVVAQCDMIDLVQFLYEFYWTPFLHRITTLDITPDENSEKLNTTMTIQGLTILYRLHQNQPYPLEKQLPNADQSNMQQQLASGPFAAYKQMGDVDVFRAVRTGIDPTSLTILTGVPTITNDAGDSVTVSRWNLSSEGKTISLQTGEELKIGSFVATIADIDENFVVLRQNNGLLWVVLLGYKLSDALAVPPNLF